MSGSDWERGRKREAEKMEGAKGRRGEREHGGPKL